jgi:hypothetical protein
VTSKYKYWLCSCGFVNRGTDTRCAKCEVSRERYATLELRAASKIAKHYSAFPAGMKVAETRRHGGKR